MSNIYITEPATNGKVILKTTVGDIEVELWSKETPLACRNFVQLCMEGYYNDTAFHRLVKGFIVQGGDPSGTGDGGESVFGKPFKTESHSRLSFNRRGLLGMACPEPDSNGSQFFFTLDEARELDKKHTLFGRVVGDTLFNMLRLAEVEVTHGDKPSRFHRILKTEVILNPYDDIVPRRIASTTKKDESEEPVSTSKATKNYALLSFGFEAEEEEEVVTKVAEKFRGKGKSAHDLANDPRLSSETVPIDGLDVDTVNANAKLLAIEAEERRKRREQAALLETAEERATKEKRLLLIIKTAEINPEDPPHKITGYLGLLADLRSEADQIRRDIARTKNATKERMEAEQRERDAAKQRELEGQTELERAANWDEKKRQKQQEAKKNPLVADFDDFRDEVASYRSKAKQLKVRKDHEADTMNLLNRFQLTLHSEMKQTSQSDEIQVDDDISSVASRQHSTAWLRCRLISEEPAPLRTVMDPNIDNPDRYDLYDPRNPLNKRKREGVTAAEPKDKRTRK